MKDINNWVEKLNLQAHPEGGMYRQTYKSHETILKAALPKRFTGDRLFSTAIYFFLNGDDFSAFHRIKQDELWHFYDGSALTIHIITPDATYSTLKLGINIDNDESPQQVVKAGSYFAVEINDKNSYSLSGCTVAPGFDFADFDMPERGRLFKLFPLYKELITKFTR